jgi:predicted phosphodiesterase
MLGIVTDIHGNFPALQAVIAELDRLGCDRIISLGDVTGYYAEPDRCIDLLVEWDAIQLLGNHDEYLVSGSGCPRSRVVSDLLRHQVKAVTAEHIAMLSNLRPNFEEGENSFVHGGWVDPLDEYLYRLSPGMLPDGYRRFFCGHTHVQKLVDFEGKTFCNPGSVGQPRDGDPRAAFAVLNGDQISLHRVAYDIDRTVAAMRAAGFDEEWLWKNLYIGAQIGGRVDDILIEY